MPEYVLTVLRSNMSSLLFDAGVHNSRVMAMTGCATCQELKHTKAGLKWGHVRGDVLSLKAASDHEAAGQTVTLTGFCQRSVCLCLSASRAANDDSTM